VGRDSDFGILPERLGYQLHRVDALSMNAIRSRLSPIGLTPARATALIFIGRHPGLDQTAIGRALNINRASAMNVVNGLVAIGAAERRPGRDRRTNAIHLTDRGEQLLREVEQASLKADEAMFGCLTVAERTELLCLLQKLRAQHVWSGDEEPAAPQHILRRAS
jgi:DNA-binding MarR family transcriptional regulator